MAIKIYTKTGDRGQTGLIGGARVSKADVRIAACGEVDELNAWIGLLADLLGAEDGKTLLRRIQDRLFTAGAWLATDAEKPGKMALPALAAADVVALESAIDRMEVSLPPLRHFILPGGHPTVSQIHIARCVCRRAERAVALLGQAHPGIPPVVQQYLNRLSDFLFVLARATGNELHAPEIPWIPGTGA